MRMLLCSLLTSTLLFAPTAVLAEGAAPESARRAELVRIERARGRTIYAIARELGVTQNAVRRMLGLRGD